MKEQTVTTFIINSLYGKFGSNPSNYEIFQTIDPEFLDPASLDEWLFYLLILVLYFLKVPYYIIIPIILIGAATIYIGYRQYWKLLKKTGLLIAK